jgi:hypothetical protein
VEAAKKQLEHEEANEAAALRRRERTEASEGGEAGSELR